MAAASVLALVVLMLVMTGYSDATWCVCRSDVSDAALQKTLDYACGAGADCKPILSNGGCFQPNTVRAHCSYAVNSYFQNKGQAQGTCIFSNTATITTTDPSTGGTCTYPSTASPTGTGNTPTTLTPPGTTTNPNTGGTGGFNSGGLGPSGTGLGDSSGGGVLLKKTELVVFVLLTLWFSGLLG
ncbi:X8 [Macleaya cordata]|uniref:X8 n=1 Tax=Macleaya cordata TaxID=56857 RepID=A0A200PRH4_MACCD|nr:X8 [Macleaya cordata]